MPRREWLRKAWDEAWEENVVNAALAHVKARVGARQYQIFHCRVMQGWDTARVVRTLKVNAAQVHLAKHRVGRMFRAEVRRLAGEMEA